MGTPLLHLYISFILIFTFQLCLELCKADKILPFKKPCDQPIDCGLNHVIAVFHVNQNKEFRVTTKNKCNGQHKCQIDTKKKNCSIKYYCIDDRFVKNCSFMNATESIGNSTDVFACYQHTNQVKGRSFCWTFAQGLYHHWIVLRGILKIWNDTDLDGTLMTNFNLITSNNRTEVCTSSKYVWIIYVGTKSPETLVNIYSTVDPAITASNQGDNDVNDKNSNKEAQFEQTGNMTGDFQNGRSVDDKEIQKDKIMKDLNFWKILIMISAIGGVLIVVAITIAILWCCCRRCNKVTISKSIPEERKYSQSDKDVEHEAPDCQLREDFIPTEAIRDTFDSVGFWTDDEDYDPEDENRYSKSKANIYAIGDCIYGRKSSKSEIYMNTGVNPTPSLEKEKDTYMNMNAQPANKHFNIFL